MDVVAVIAQSSYCTRNAWDWNGMQQQLTRMDDFVMNVKV